MHKKGREKTEEGSKLSSKSVNGLRQKVQKKNGYFFSCFGPLVYTKMAVSISSMDLCLPSYLLWTVLHAWLHYGISIKTMHFGHCLNTREVRLQKVFNLE